MDDLIAPRRSSAFFVLLLLMFLLLHIAAPAQAGAITASTTDSPDGNYTLSWSSGYGLNKLLERFNGGPWVIASFTEAVGTASTTFTDKPAGVYQYWVQPFYICFWSPCAPPPKPTVDVTVNVGDGSSALDGYSAFNANTRPNSRRFLVTPDVSSDGSYTLSWLGVDYWADLRELKPGGNWVSVAASTSTNNSYSVTGRAPGIYQYRLYGCVLSDSCYDRIPVFYVTVADPADGPVPSTPEHGVLRNSDSPLSNNLSISTDGNYTLSWTARPRINYLLQVQSEYGDWSTVFEGYTSGYQTQSYSAENVENNSGIHYRLMACGLPAVFDEPEFGSNCTIATANDSEHTVTVNRSNAPAPIGGIQAPALSNSDSYTLEWSVSASTNVTYRLEERVGTDGLWQVVQETAGRSYEATGQTNGTYYYRVRVCTAEGFCSTASPIVSVLVESAAADVVFFGNYYGSHFLLNVPTGVNYTGNYTVSWVVVPVSTLFSTPDYFIVQENDGSGNWQDLPTSGSATSFEVNGRSSGVYSYRIWYCDTANITGLGSFQLCGATGESQLEVDREGTASLALPSAEVGSTAGNFKVDQQGSAGYSIAIADLPGRGGVTPNLSLNYSSGSGNSYMGVGWSLGGLSSISRCRQTYETDQRDRVVMLDDQDRFCLDGARLIAVDGGGAYGAVGSEYRTEVDQSLRVRSEISSVTGKRYFKVWRKDGSVSEYGNSIDSAVIAQNGTGNTVTTWGQNKFSDSAGNYIDYLYTNDAVAGRFHIDRVDYTGNESVGVATHSHIKFNYDENSSGSTVLFSLGAKHSVSARLESIEVKEGGDTLFRRYDLRYAASKGTQRSLLRSIQECVSTTVCLPATQFDWHEPEQPLQHERTMGSYRDDYLGGRPIDVNGDGKQDWLWLVHNGNYRFRLSYSDGTSLVESSFSVSAPSAARESWQVIDYNNDGYQDLIYATSGGWVVHLSDGANLSQAAIDIGIPSTGSSKAIFSDLNADGLVDILYQDQSNNLKARYLLKQDAWSADEPYRYGDEKSLTIPATAGANYTYIVGANYTYINKADLKEHPPMDLNGDGKTDVLLKITKTTIVEGNNEYGIPLFDVTEHWALFTMDPDINSVTPTQLLPVASTESELTTLLPLDADDFRLIDINGDGLTDIFKKVSGGWQYLLNNGEYFEPAVLVGAIGSPNKMRFADIDGDRALDLISLHNKKHYVVRYWRGNGYSNPQPIDPVEASNPNHMDNTYTVAFLDIDGDSYSDLLSVDTASDSYYLVFNRFDRTPQDLIHRITNGFGAKTEINYTTLTNDQDLIYTRGHGASAFDWGNGSPVFDLNTPMHVVSQISSSAPTENNPDHMAELEYFYQGLRIQAGGRGFLGFEYLTTYDPQSGVLVDTQYRQDFPFAGMPLQTIKYHLDSGTLLSVADNEWQQNTTSSNTVYPYISESTETTYDPDSGELLSSVITTNAYNTYDDIDYANLGTITVEILDATGTLVSRKITDNIYDNTVEPEQWHLGRLTDTTVTHVRPGQPTTTRTAQFGYDTNTGILNTEIIEPAGAANEKLTTVYAFDAYGQRLSTAQCSSNASCGSPGFDESDPNFISRQSRVEMDSTHRFVNKSYNSQNHLLKSVTQRDTFGRAKEVDLINGNHLTTVYDDWGRTTSTTTTPGITTTYEYQLCTNSTEACPLGAVYLSLQTTSTGQKTVQYFDVLGREVRKSALGFKGETIQTDTHYDAVGQVAKVSSPYFAGGVKNWTETGYDHFGRVTHVTLPDGSSSTISYEGLQTTTTNALDQTQIEITNLLGETVKIIDAKQGVLTNTYDAQGNLLTVEGVDGEVISMEYDTLGRKTSMTDPDKGTWSYQYNARGELVSQTDAKGQTTTQRYDALGRMIKRTSASEDIRWSYDSATNGTGKLHSVINNHDGYQNIISYNEYGRVESTEIKITGIPSYTSEIGYDAYGRVNSQTGVDGRTIRSEYNSQGYAARTLDESSGTILSEIIEMDARGQVIERQSGNGLTTTNQYDPQTSRLTHTQTGNNIQNLAFSYDLLGNVNERTDNSGNKDLFEAFDYDELNRLTAVRTQDSNSTSLLRETTVSYYANGNINNKSDVGTYQYGANGAGPHAVTSAGGDSGFIYDANGNQTSGKGRTLQYSSFDKLTSVTQNGHATTFNYGTGHSRYKRVDTDSNNNVTTTYYLGGIELIKKNNQFVEYRNNLGGVQITTEYGNNNNSAEIRYLYKDHLGSLDVITDANGALLESYSFDAWGKRRAINSWDPLSAAEIQSHYINTDHTTNRGYTGHEQMYEVGLIHMNGRIYDPMLGRVLQADPNIDGVGSTQGYNRYSYVHNNPLAYTDPSGFSSWTKFRDKWLKPIVAIVITIYMPGMMAGTWAWAAGAAAGSASVAAYAVTGFVAGAISTGTLKGAALGAFSGVVFGSIGASGMGDVTRMGAHAMAGGVMSVLQGGKFGHGFISAGITKGVGLKLKMEDVFAKGVVMSMLGGTLTEASGGKFAHGATTAAFAYAFNELQQKAAREAAQQGQATNSCSGSLSCKVAEDSYGNADFDGKGYGDAPSLLFGETNVKWGTYQCKCSSTGEKFRFVGPGKRYGANNLYGVFEHTQYGASGGYLTESVNQVNEGFTVDLNSNYDQWIYRGFINAFESNNQTVP